MELVSVQRNLYNFSHFIGLVPLCPADKEPAHFHHHLSCSIVVSSKNWLAPLLSVSNILSVCGPPSLVRPVTQPKGVCSQRKPVGLISRPGQPRPDRRWWCNTEKVLCNTNQQTNTQTRLQTPTNILNISDTVFLMK